MKKHFRFLSKSVLASVAISSAAVSCGLILSSCANTNSDDNNNDNSSSNEIKIENQSPDTHEVDSENGLTLYVVVQSNKPIKYQWFVDKNNNDGWTSIKDATDSSYSIPNDLIQNITTNTTWKYKVEIYDADDANIKITSNIYNVNIKPQSSTPNPSPKPDPDPTPPTPNPDPSPTPPTNPDSNPSTSINQSSIELKNIRQLLPSQYLSDLTSATLNRDLIVENFDTSKITNASYTVNALDDKAGTLSLLMKYRENNVDKTYTFNFTNLLHFDNGAFELEFTNATDILNLSARDIANKKLNSKSEFESFLKELESSNIKFKFKNKGNELSLKYLSFDSINITGFNTNWFTSNNKISLTFNFKNLKINYYQKIANGSVDLKSFEYPSNKDKSAMMWFYSAVDYLLNQVTNKTTYTTNEYAAYYYYDIINNEATHAQVKISDSYWLSNVTNYLNYDGNVYTYKLILNKNSNVSSENGSLTINLSMEYQANSTSANAKSKKTKDVTVTGFAKYDQKNLFSNSSDEKGKFSLGCESENYDKNIAILSSIGRIKNLIINEINSMSELETSISFDGKIPLAIINSLKNSLICKFSGYELTAGTKNSYYHNNLTAISGFEINSNETYLRYNKTDDVFQLVINDFTIIGEGVGDDKIATNTNSMSVNITHPNKSLENLKKSNI